MWAGGQSLQEMQPSSYIPGLIASFIKFFCVAWTSGVFNQVVPRDNSTQEGFCSIRLKVNLLKMSNQKRLTPAYLRTSFPVGPAFTGSGWQEG